MYRLSPKFALRHAALTASAAAIVCLSGCAGISGTAVPSSLTTTIPAGSVHGGQQPIQGAHVFVYATGTTGYGSASTSLLTGGTTDTTAGSITQGANYVTTDASGGFTYGGLTVTCPTPTTEIYLLATGGNPTGLQGGAVNGAIAMTAALGLCSGISATTFTSMNEVTTAAMAFALGTQFMVDGAHVGAPVSNGVGITNAFATIANLVDPTTGTALATTPLGNGTAPQATVNTLANIVAPCANSGSGASASCQSLYTATTPTNATVPTNVLTSLLNIAAFPAANVSSLYTLAAATAPFQPALSTAPNDFSLGITYSASPTTISTPGAIVVDGSGNVWLANCPSCLYNPQFNGGVGQQGNVPLGTVDTLVEFSPTGQFLGSFGAGILHDIQGIAINPNNDTIFTVNQATNSAHPADELIPVNIATGTPGAPITSPNFGVDSLQGITFDQPGDIWLSALNGMYDPGNGLQQVGGTVLVMNQSGVQKTGSPFNTVSAPGTNLAAAGPAAIATDNSSNVWVLGSGNNSLMKFNGTSTGGTYVDKYTPTGFSTPLGIAINGGNELWITENNNTLSHIYGYNGANASGSPISNLGLYQAQLLTVDGSGQVLIPNCRVGCPGSGSTAPDNLLRLSAVGTPDTGGSGANFGSQAGFTAPGSAASDASGAVWVSNSANGTVTQVIGFATPTIVPLARATTSQLLGNTP